MSEETPPLEISIETPSPVAGTRFAMGTAHSPDGRELTANSRSLLLDGKPWLPVMGEFHYSRSPKAEWRTELLKIKAGGISVVATYVFWIHHEEVQGAWDWSERRDLRAFVQMCGEVGLLVIARLGPWCHGEVRNGGFPDWLVRDVPGVRTDDPTYLAHTRQLYAQLYEQLSGLFWKDGGPVIGVQCENEYGGPAEHLLTLKRIAIESGFDVPLYTRTGWPDLSTPMPEGGFFPLFGGYPDGFWDRSTQEMPLGYRGAYLFTKTRADGAIATDLLGEREVGESDEDRLYPYFACEIGGGMECSYHRRIRIAPQDIAALGLVKLGSGNNLQGYYMYHGGTNPDGEFSTLQESQATGYWNDVPTKSYDFQAPIGEFGQVRPHYHMLRRMHLFLNDFGDRLAVMPMFLPQHRPADPDDTKTLRWAVRTDGIRGFVFINNYQRLQAMPPKQQTRFHLCLLDACVKFPAAPVTFPADTAAFWPFQFDLDGLDLVSATAQPVCRLNHVGTSYFVFAEMAGVAAEFVFASGDWTLEETTGQCRMEGDRLGIANVEPGLRTAISLRHVNGQRRAVLLLDQKQSLSCWKETLLGKERLFLTQASLTIENDQIRLSSDDPNALPISVFPAPSCIAINGNQVSGVADGLFHQFTAPSVPGPTCTATWEQIQNPGVPRNIPTGSQGVAEAPTDGDFLHAAIWRVSLPKMLEADGSMRLRIRYVGDVARIEFDGTLLTDNFYNGDAFEVGLTRYAPDVYDGELLLKILPLQRGAPIYLPGDAWPDFHDDQAVARLESIEIVHEHRAVLDFTDE